MGVNRELLKLASWRVQEHIEKQAVVPPGGGDPMAGGGAPPMGGPPPPPMDPMMGGPPPPMDPMAGGPPMGPPPMGPPPMDPMGGGGGDIRTIIQEELANAGMGGNGAAAGGPAGAKAKKFDPAELDIKLYNMEKLIAAMASALGVSLPPEALLGPPPEGTTGPEGAASPAGLEGGGDMAGPDSAIKPIEPVQPAMPGAPPEAPKMASHWDPATVVPHVGEPIAASSVSAASISQKAAALAQMARNANQRGH